jgi:hypothetical protein
VVVRPQAREIIAVIEELVGVTDFNVIHGCAEEDPQTCEDVMKMIKV